MKKGIVVLGSTNTDMVITGRRIPVPGETVSGGTFMMNPGGKGANQAVAVARLSAKRGACTGTRSTGTRGSYLFPDPNIFPILDYYAVLYRYVLFAVAAGDSKINPRARA